MYFKILLFIIFFKEMKIDIDNRSERKKLYKNQLKIVDPNNVYVRFFNLFGVNNNAIQLLGQARYEFGYDYLATVKRNGGRPGTDNDQHIIFG